MSELDEKRIKNFLTNIKNIQVIITCTKNIEIENSTSYHIQNGNIIAWQSNFFPIKWVYWKDA